MIKIEDGRKQFYQWDLGQRLTVEGYAAGTEVHFAHRRKGPLSSLKIERQIALIVEIYEEGGKYYADVPNILLQIAGELCVFIYPESDGESHTAYRKVLDIFPRAKPDDYIYTETEVKRWEDLAKGVEEALAASLSAANGANAAANSASAAARQAEDTLKTVNAKIADADRAAAAANAAAEAANTATANTTTQKVNEAIENAEQATEAANTAADAANAAAEAAAADVLAGLEWKQRLGKNVLVRYNDAFVHLTFLAENVVAQQNDITLFEMPDGIAPVADRGIIGPIFTANYYPTEVIASVGMAADPDASGYTVRARYTSIPTETMVIQFYAMFPRDMFNITE